MPDSSTALKIDPWRLQSQADLNALREQIAAGRDPQRAEVVICHGTGCLANGSEKVARAFKAAIAAAGLDAKVVPGIKTTGCHGFCSRGPLVIIRPQGIFYQRVQPKDVQEIVSRTLVEGAAVERLLYKDPSTREVILNERDIPFYKLQQRVVLHNIGKIDPTDITDTIAAGGYQALAKAFTTLTPEQVVEQIEKSGLRGRGGAGFPTGRKWRSALAAIKKKGRPVYVVVNGDEGDPGAFMDRTIMEGDPHAVLEGLILGHMPWERKKGICMCARNIRWPSATWKSPWPRRELTGFWARISSIPVFPSMRASIAAPALSYAANRPLCSLRSRVNRAIRVRNTCVRWKKGCGGARPF